VFCVPARQPANNKGLGTAALAGHLRVVDRRVVHPFSVPCQFLCIIITTNLFLVQETDPASLLLGEKGEWARKFVEIEA
jgi:hypothetical protein